MIRALLCHSNCQTPAELPAFEQTIVPEFKGAVRAVLKKIHRPSIGVKMGEIANYSSTSSPMGQLKKMFG